MIPNSALHAIQLAIAPVFMLAAVAALIAPAILRSVWIPAPHVTWMPSIGS